MWKYDPVAFMTQVCLDTRNNLKEGHRKHRSARQVGRGLPSGPSAKWAEKEEVLVQKNPVALYYYIRLWWLTGLQ